MKILWLLFASIVIVCGDRVKFDGYKVYRILSVDKHQNDFLSTLRQNDHKLDFWTGIGLGTPTDIMVSPEDNERFMKSMKMYGIKPEVFIEDVQKLILEQVVGNNFKNMSWDQYYDLEGIYSWLDTLPSLYPGNVEPLTIGPSHEGRPIKGVKISFGAGKKPVMFEGGIHAREWISPATVTYIIHQLLTSNDTLVRRIAASFDWHIFPVTNPDGYVYSHTTNRLWRKTRKPYGTCAGADPNRNFDFYWSQNGASNNSCSDTFMGGSVFSEPETAAIRDYVQPIGSSLVMYLSFHSHGQLFLLPFANTTDHLGNYNGVKELAENASAVIFRKYGSRYRSGNSAEILYYSSGTSKDWVKDKYDVPIVFTVELRDTGRYGFLLPPDQILPNNEEMWDGIIDMFLSGERLGYLQLNPEKNST